MDYPPTSDTSCPTSAMVQRGGMPGSELRFVKDADSSAKLRQHRVGSLLVSVQDTGAGLSPEQLAALFGEGVQFNANELQAGQGSGLGLFITKGLVEQHGGRIWATSEGLGKGTTFNVELPLFDTSDPECRELLEQLEQSNNSSNAGISSGDGKSSGSANSGFETLRALTRGLKRVSSSPSTPCNTPKFSRFRKKPFSAAAGATTTAVSASASASASVVNINRDPKSSSTTLQSLSSQHKGNHSNGNDSDGNSNGRNYGSADSRHNSADTGRGRGDPTGAGAGLNPYTYLHTNAQGEPHMQDQSGSGLAHGYEPASGLPALEIYGARSSDHKDHEEHRSVSGRVGELDSPAVGIHSPLGSSKSRKAWGEQPAPAPGSGSGLAPGPASGPGGTDNLIQNGADSGIRKNAYAVLVVPTTIGPPSPSFSCSLSAVPSSHKGFNKHTSSSEESTASELGAAGARAGEETVRLEGNTDVMDQKQQQRRRPRRRPRRRRVLVVDDAQSNRKILMRLLQARGHHCEEAVNGQLAVYAVEASLRSGSRDKLGSSSADPKTAADLRGGDGGAGEAEDGAFDTILMDFEMPVMNGPTATRRIREMGFAGTIVGVTGNVLHEDRQFFLSHGADAVLPKPLKLADLEALWS